MIIATTPEVPEGRVVQTLGVENGMLMVTASGTAVKLGA